MAEGYAEPNDSTAARPALDARLRAELGRRLTVVALYAPAQGDEQDELFTAFQAEIAKYQEVWLRVVEVGAPGADARSPTEAAAEAAVRAALQADADAVLVWRMAGADGAAPGATSVAQAMAARWRRDFPAVAERLALFEQATLALIGADVTRADARRQGYEDGFALTEPLAAPTHAALLRLAAEALARVEYQRRGSSPPCYL